MKTETCATVVAVAMIAAYVVLVLAGHGQEAMALGGMGLFGGLLAKGRS